MTIQLPNKLGVHALVWVGGWTHEECREAIKNTVEAGYDLIEIPALDPSLIDVEHTKKTLEEFGIKAACSLGLSFDADINNEDLEVVKRGEAKLMAALDVVAGIGGDYLGGVLFSALGKYSHPATKVSWANAAASLKKLAIAAQAKGITIGLEPVNRYESNLINTIDQAVEMIKDIGEPNVKVHIDIYHMNIEEQDLSSPIINNAEHIGYVHIGASHRGGLGTGNVDFDELFGALAKINYKGVITFESFSSAIVHPDLSLALAIWRNLWTENKPMALNARKYMVEHIIRANKL
jgi:D-psicose/D-tagatose/L-ribulose 3-epimerase